MSDRKVPGTIKRVLRRVTKWQLDSDDASELGEDSPPITELDEANVVTSEVVLGLISFVPRHAPVLDLDIPHHYEPSTTPGHGHLYLDVSLTQYEWERLMETLADLRIIERGYWEASKRRGYSAVRLPWVKKETEPEEHSDGVPF